jgi:tetratricopeptide (TPR) repeat protein
MTTPNRLLAFSGPSAAATATAVNDPLQAALTLRAQGRLQEALDVLSSSGEFMPDHYTLRGDLQLELGQFKEAAGSYFTVTVSAPDNIYAQCNLGMCLRRLERWEQAAEAFQAVLNLDAHRDPIRLELADCLLHLNRFEPALECFDQCWSDAARRPALFGKAVALQLLRRFDEAETVYERVLTLDSRAEEAYSNLIAMSVERVDLERVQRFSQRLLEVNPRSLVGFQGIALVAIERGEVESAARSFFHIVEAAPDSIRASGEDSDGSVEYRVSRKVIERLQESRG